MVLLAAHRMIGICQKVGDYTSVDPAEALDWSTDRVNKLIEDIIDTCERYNFRVGEVQRFTKKEAKFLDKERKASLF